MKHMKKTSIVTAAVYETTAAVYARVSTLDQKNDMQFSELVGYCQRNGWAVIEYAEKMSSIKRRPVLERLMQDAALHKFDVVVVWKIDRFARSMKQFVDNVLALDSAGIRFVAPNQGIDTGSQSPTGKFLMHILAAFAELERNMIVERVRAGMDEARRQGIHCGRPVRVWRRDEAMTMRDQGMSLRAIATKLNLPLSTVVNGLNRVPKG
jgi:DNA invertase Pin-like site-specific DNA recombinase